MFTDTLPDISPDLLRNEAARLDRLAAIRPLTAGEQSDRLALMTELSRR